MSSCNINPTLTPPGNPRNQTPPKRPRSLPRKSSHLPLQNHLPPPSKTQTVPPLLRLLRRIICLSPPSEIILKWFRILQILLLLPLQNNIKTGPPPPHPRRSIHPPIRHKPNGLHIPSPPLCSLRPTPPHLPPPSTSKARSDQHSPPIQILRRLRARIWTYRDIIYDVRSRRLLHPIPHLPTHSAKIRRIKLLQMLRYHLPSNLLLHPLHSLNPRPYRSTSRHVRHHGC